jgi:hypothetical protein
MKHLWHYAVDVLANTEYGSYNQGIADKSVYIIHILHCTPEDKREF